LNNSNEATADSYDGTGYSVSVGASYDNP
jgi:hypothetical protein